MKKIILVLEDDETQREIMSRVLREYNLILTATLAEARAALASIQPDLVITDGVLSDGDGAAWAEEIFASGQMVLLVSGSEKSKIVPYLDKPVVHNELKRMIREMLGQGA
ncbi:MAG: response regulator [Candidatus Doudnabacteria bacterium]